MALSKKQEFERFFSWAEGAIKDAETILEHHSDSKNTWVIPELCFKAVEKAACFLILKNTGKIPGKHGVNFIQFKTEVVMKSDFDNEIFEIYKKIKDEYGKYSYNFETATIDDILKLVSDAKKFIFECKTFALTKRWDV